MQKYYKLVVRNILWDISMKILELFERNKKLTKVTKFVNKLPVVNFI